jgi:hypothetical protein
METVYIEQQDKKALEIHCTAIVIIVNNIVHLNFCQEGTTMLHDFSTILKKINKAIVLISFEWLSIYKICV